MATIYLFVSTLLSFFAKKSNHGRSNSKWSWNRGLKARRNTTSHSFGIAAHVEYLEARTLLSATSIAPLQDADLNPQAHPNVDQIATPSATATPSSGLTPSKIMSAYGFDQLSLSSGLNGTGQTIAIVGAYHNPTLLQDLKTFSTTFGLPDPPSITVMSQTGSTTNLPANDPTKAWALESALDVQWAHALAPGANIVMVEANSSGFSDLMAAVKTAANLPGVSVVSMSFGTTEFAAETFYDSYFKTPAGHQGVTFIAASGDRGNPADYPAYSPNVLAVGGTTLNVSSTGAYISESAWSGSGGGISQVEAQPAYQKGIVTQSTTKRTAPDVSFDASTASAVAVISTYVYGTSTPWVQVGGTSFSAPAWGAIVATANQARTQNGLGTLDGSTQTLPMLYQLSQSNPLVFRDITTGTNGYAAGTGYDLATGLGTPVVNALVPALSGTATSVTPSLAFQQSPSSGVAGTTLSSIKVSIKDKNGNVMTSDNSAVTLTIASGPAGFASGSTVTVNAINGIATFTNLTFNTAGTYTLKATSGSDTPATSAGIIVSAAAASKAVFQTVPTTGVAGAALGSIKVSIQDQFGNIVTTDNSSVTLSVSSGPGSFASSSTLSVNAVNGVATFSNLLLNIAGTYTLKASNGTRTAATSSGISVAAASATKIAFLQLPASGTAGTSLGTIKVAIEDQYGNVVTTSNSPVTLSVGSGPDGFASGSTVTVTAASGIATFSNVILNTAGTYAFTASDGVDTVATATGIAVKAAAPAQVEFRQMPMLGTAGTALGPVILYVEDQFGNLVMTDSSTVTLTINIGPSGFATGSTTSVNAVNGIATFTNLSLNIPGSYTLMASSSGIADTGAGAKPAGLISGLTITGTPVITASASGGVYNGSPYSGSATVVGAAGSTVSGTTAYKYYQGSGITGPLLSGPPTNAGTYTLVALFTSSDSYYTDTTSAPVTFTISSATPTVTVTALGGSFTGTVYSASASVTGIGGVVVSGTTTYTYYDAQGNSLGTVAPVNAGTYGVSASFQSGEANYGNASSPTVSFTIASATPTVAVTALGGTYNGSAYNAIASVKGIDGATVSGTTVFTYYDASGNSLGTTAPVNAGTYGVSASFQSNDANYGNASSAVVNFTISSATTPTVTVTALGGTYNGTAYSANASVTGEGGATVNGTTTFTYYDAKGNSLGIAAPVNAGTYGVTALFQSSDANYGNSSSTFVSFTISAATPTVTVTAMGGTYNGAAYSASASVTGIDGATVSGTTVFTYYDASGNSLGTTAPVNAGTYGVSASFQSSDANYGNSSSTTVSFTISAATPIVTVSALGGTYKGTAYSATASSKGIGGETVSGVTTFTYYDAKGNSLGTAAPINAGTYGVSASFQSSDTNYGNAACLIVSFTISRATPTVTVTALGGLYTGTAYSATASVTGIGGATVSGTTTFTYYDVNGNSLGASAPIAAGNYSVSASFQSSNANYGNASSATVNFLISPAASTAGAAAKVVFLNTNPSTVSAGDSTTITGVIVDKQGNVVTTDNSTVLTLKANGAVVGTVTATGGIAVFRKLQFTKAGSVSMYFVTSTGIGSGTSTLTVAPNAPAKLATSYVPYVVAGQTFAAINVTVQDAYNNTVTTDASPISLAVNTLSGGPAAGGNPLLGIPSSSYAKGVTTFTGLSIGAVGSYSITFSYNANPSVTGITTNVFKISAGAATGMAVKTGLSATATAGSAISTFQIAVVDQFGNVVQSDSSVVTVSITNGGAFSTGSSTVSVKASCGIATFYGLTINQAGAYSLTATNSGSLVNGTVAVGSITINPASATALVLAASPSASTESTSTPIVILIQDKYGNVVTSNNSAVVTLKLNGIVVASVTAVNGVATFSDLKLTTLGANSLSVSSSLGLNSLISVLSII